MWSTRQRLLLVAIAGVAAAILAMRSSAFAAPEPSIVPPSWELDFKHGLPGIIAFTIPGQTQSRLYGYLPFTVMNRTGEDRLFAPELAIWTDAGQLSAGNRGVSPLVFNAIKQDLQNPLLESPAKIIGRLLQGEDNARDSVVMWTIDHKVDVNVLRIFIGGLSGETQETADPNTGETIILKKTLMLEYHTPGDELHAGTKPFILKERQWVMR